MITPQRISAGQPADQPNPLTPMRSRLPTAGVMLGERPAADTGGIQAAGVGIGLQLLRAIIVAGARSEFRRLTDEVFTPEERPYYAFAAGFYTTHGVLPTAEAMAENNYRLAAAAPSPVSYYMERVYTRAQYNALIAEQPALVAALRDRNMDAAGDVLARLNAGFNRYTSQQDVFTLRETLDEVIQDYEYATAHPGMQGVTLGWGVLDAMTGGAEPGDMVTLVGRPGEGKSWLAIHMARQAWMAGTSVLLVTNEMTHRQVGRRLLGLHAGVNPNFLRQGELSTAARDVVYQTAVDMRTGAPFHLISGSFKKTVPAVEAAIEQYSPGLVVIDASYLMKPERANNRMAKHELLGAVGEELKTMAMRRGVPVVQTVQFNREQTKSKIGGGLEDIGGSDVVGQISTIVVTVNKGPLNYESTRRTLAVRKNREGPSNESFLTNFLFGPPNFDHLPTNEQGEVIVVAIAPDEDRDPGPTAGPTFDEWDVT